MSKVLPTKEVLSSIKALLEIKMAVSAVDDIYQSHNLNFRKVNKSYRGRSCPICVHCSDGVGRSGTYVLVDMVLNRMAKG